MKIPLAQILNPQPSTLNLHPDHLRHPNPRTGGLDVIRKEAWPFCRTISGVRLCWELEEPRGHVYFDDLRATLGTACVLICG